MYPHNTRLTANAKALRKGMTKEEKHLWYDFFVKLPITVKRQYCIENYILDFFIPSYKIAIELDGSQHFEPEAMAKDAARDKVLSNYGITVLRYTNIDIKKRFDGVASDILNHLGLAFSDLKFDR